MVKKTKNLMQFLGVLLICIFLVNCLDDRVKVLGDDVYYISFKPDWSVFDSGTYQYGFEKERGFGNTNRGVYDEFYNIHLSFKMKGGREYKETVDIASLVKNLGESQQVFDVRKTEWGGSSRVIFYFEKNHLKIVYEVRERIRKGKMVLAKSHIYPLLEKALN